MVVILFAFGCLNSIWGAQAASADFSTSADITSVSQLTATETFISDEGLDTEASLTDLTAIPGITVSLPDIPVAAPTSTAASAPITLSADIKPEKPVARGKLTFTASHGCDPATDFASGALKSEPKSYIETLLRNGWSIRISCASSGHSENVRGTQRTSLHTVGEGFDIDTVNGETVGRGKPETRRFYRWLKDQPNASLPWEIGGPHVPEGRTKVLRKQGQTGGPFFTNAGHQGHWHFGFKPVANTVSAPADKSEDMATASSKAPALPQTPPAFVLPPPPVKEEKAQPDVEVAPETQPDPQDDENSSDQKVFEPIITELPPQTDTPSIDAEPAPAENDRPDKSDEKQDEPETNDPTPSENESQAKPVSVNPEALQADYNRLESAGVLPIIERLAAKHGIDYAVALALPSRETSSRNVEGDGGHGHCYLQIDDRSHQEWLSTNDWRNPAECFDYGFAILRGNIDRFDGDIFKALAAYNSGAGNVRKSLRQGKSAEARTAHGNYSSDTLARAEFYRNMLATNH